jgi:thioredoxin 1
MGKPVEVTDDTFDQEVLKSDKPVLVDFWAEWCGPCRMVSPIVEELAEEYDGKAKFAKVDVDENADISMEYNIRSIPSLLLFKDGEVVDQVVGAVPKSQLKKKLDDRLNGN